jgi:hypothetical protein
VVFTARERDLRREGRSCQGTGWWSSFNTCSDVVERVLLKLRDPRSMGAWNAETKLRTSHLLWLLPGVGLCGIAGVAFWRARSTFVRVLGIIVALLALGWQSYATLAAAILHGWVTCRGDWSCEAESTVCRCSGPHLALALAAILAEVVWLTLLVLRRARTVERDLETPSKV